MNEFKVTSPRLGGGLMTMQERGIRDCTDVLLKSPSSISKMLSAADKHMQTKMADPDMFLVPKVHEFLVPVIDAYSNDAQGFIDYIVRIRDNFDKSDKTWADIQKVYRRVNGRTVQQIRRERASRACAKAQEIYGETDYHSRLQWVADLEHEWAGRRLEFMQAHRSRYKSDRLDTETRADVLEDFWAIIDKEIEEGRNISPWN